VEERLGPPAEGVGRHREEEARGRPDGGAGERDRRQFVQSRRRPRGPDGSHEDEASHLVGLVRRQVGADEAAERVTEQIDRREMVDPVREPAGGLVWAEPASVPGDVDRDDVALSGEQRQRRSPPAGRRGQAVDEDERPGH
jgi:hypothetical protein